ncbi:MAG: SGNH/GDSL hydrolase family protein [Kiritimatiellaeota bacterium]|nr:SGNH/GDSL hydrolase family protein [Kiritimatiellota bacterium]
MASLTGIATSAVLFLPLATAVDATGREPTNLREMKKKAPREILFDKARDALRKAQMSPGELAWETVLEENLGDFYLPRYKAAKEKGRITAWDYVEDDPALPRVLLIGDSISRGYTVPVRRALAGKVNVHRAPANCGSTSLALEKLSLWLGDGKWDLIHFNFGIHDRNTKPEVYAENLEKIIAALRTTGAKLVWATTTPVPDDTELYQAGCSERVNALATPLIRKHGIPIDDLYALAKPHSAEWQVPHDCHFRPEGYERLGIAVAQCILEQLAGARQGE